MDLTKKIDWVIWLQCYTEVTSKLTLIFRKRTRFCILWMSFTVNSDISHWKNKPKKSDMKFIDLKALLTLSFLTSSSAIARLKSCAIYFIISSSLGWQFFLQENWGLQSPSFLLIFVSISKVLISSMYLLSSMWTVHQENRYRWEGKVGPVGQEKKLYGANNGS